MVRRDQSHPYLRLHKTMLATANSANSSRNKGKTKLRRLLGLEQNGLSQNGLSMIVNLFYVVYGRLKNVLVLYVVSNSLRLSHVIVVVLKLFCSSLGSSCC